MSRSLEASFLVPLALLLICRSSSLALPSLKRLQSEAKLQLTQIKSSVNPENLYARREISAAKGPCQQILASPEKFLEGSRLAADLFRLAREQPLVPNLPQVPGIPLIPLPAGGERSSPYPALPSPEMNPQHLAPSSTPELPWLPYAAEGEGNHG